ncbi:MAG: hypothetical protein RXR32_03295 [Candidatus Micrarchaeota archaeon]
MASDDIDFMDLVCITKITPDTVLEKFGSLINASFFDGSKVAGTLKQKGLIDFSASYPGPSKMLLTDDGKKLIDEANAKSTEPFDDLDKTILAQLSGGRRNPSELGASLNLRPKDLALRLYKLSKQEYITYELKNGGVEVMLTEKGFLAVPKAQGVQQTAQPSAQQAGGTEPTDHELEAQIAQNVKTRKSSKKVTILLAIVLIIIIAVALYYKHLI